jgi:hypothetical protein
MCGKTAERGVPEKVVRGGDSEEIVSRPTCTTLGRRYQQPLVEEVQVHYVQSHNLHACVCVVKVPHSTKKIYGRSMLRSSFFRSSQ